MNREIKFRGKAVDDGEWLIGDIVHRDSNNKSVSNIQIKPFDYGWAYAVDKSTVGQFTGLTDKNGKEIFEGDIIHERINRILTDKRIVKYYKGSFIAESTATFCDQAYGSSHEKFQTLKYLVVNDLDIEVIGNIHDNK